MAEMFKIPGTKMKHKKGIIFLEIIDEEKFSIWQWAYGKAMENKN